MDFAGIELQKGYYRVRDSEEPGWEAVARFDWVETGLGPGLGRAYFGHAFHEDRRFFVPEKHVTSGRSTIEPVVLQEALTVDATYAVVLGRTEGRRFTNWKLTTSDMTLLREHRGDLFVTVVARDRSGKTIGSTKGSQRLEVD